MWSPHPVLLRLAACALVTLACRRARAAEGIPRPLREPIEAVAGSEVGLLVVTPSGAVKVLDAAGRVLRVLWPPGEPAGRGRRAMAPLPAWPGLTADGDFSGAAYDPDDIDDADDPRLADDTAARPWDIDDAQARPRVARSPPGRARAPKRTLVAVAGAAGWVARGDGLWAVDLPAGPARHVYGGGASRIRALAAGPAPAGGAIVALVDGERLLRADAGASNGDLAFATVAGPVGPLGGLAIGPAGTLLVLAGDGALRAYVPGGPRTGDGGLTLFSAGVDDVVACDSGALLLSDEMLWLVTDQAASATGGVTTPALRRLGPAPPGTERLACAHSGGGWVAFGAGVATSTDQGRTWETRVPPASLPVRAAVPVPAALWIAMPMGLWPLPAAGTARLAAAAEADLRAAPTMTAGGGASGTSDFWQRWSALLPVVDVDFELGRLGLVREVRGMVTASFRLDPPWWAAAVARPRRRRTDARPEAQAARQLDALAIGGGDPIAEDERRALARILEEFP